MYYSMVALESQPQTFSKFCRFTLAFWYFEMRDHLKEQKWSVAF